MPEKVTAWKVGRVYYPTEESATKAEQEQRIKLKADAAFNLNGLPHIPAYPDANIMAWWISDNAKLLREILSD